MKIVRFLKKVIGFIKKNMMQPVDYARSIGVKVGSDCRFSGNPDWGSEPYLISIGNHVLLSCKIMFLTHDGSTFVFRETEEYKNIYKFGTITIGNNCFVGASTIFLPDVKVGDNCIIGAGSIVTKDIPSGEVWAGVPAKYITTTKEYAEKCKRQRLPYDDEQINKNKRSEMLRVLNIDNEA